MSLFTKYKKIYSNIDYLKVKISDLRYDTLCDSCGFQYTRNDFLGLSTEFLKSYFIFDTFHIVDFGFIGTSKHRFDIFDKDLNKVGNIIFAVKKYKSNISYIEFSGLFFKCYSDYLNDFYKYFSIDIYKYGILKRIDYCIDLIGFEAFEVLRLLKKDKNYKGSPVQGLTADDFKRLCEKRGAFEHGLVKTAYTIPGAYNKLIIYDKKLDIFENYLNRKVAGKNPYKDYLDSKNPIVRIELSKKGTALKHLKNNSIYWVINNIEFLYYDYIMRYFIFDFRKFTPGTINSLNGQKIHICQKKQDFSLEHSLMMFKTYGNKLKSVLSDDKFASLYETFFD